MDSRSCKARSVGPFLLGGTKISLDVLGTLAAFIPVPGIKTVIDAARRAIGAAEAAHSNWEAREKLTDYIYALMLVIVTSLQKKKEAQIPPHLQKNMGRLSKDLAGIAEELWRLNKDTDPRRTTGLVRSFFLASKLTDQIQDCMNRLNWAMDLFQVTSHIDDSVRVYSIEHDVRDMRGITQDMREDTRETLLVVRKLTGLGAPQKDFLHLSTILPPKPAIFCGRDEEVNDIADRILTTPSPRFAIRGPGGIGKTSTAIAVSEHPDIVRHFGSLRFCARCEEANSPGLLVDLLARALQVTTRSDDPLRDVTLALSSDDRPRLLLLDNFETPLDINGHQSDILDILSSLCSIAHVSILLTLRGALPGPNLIQWSRPELPPLSTLSPEAAREMYISIHPQATEDKKLDTLLIELGGMPLAVKLTAERGRLGDSPSTLLELWREEGPDVVDEPGADRRTSVNKSIELSLQTNTIKGNPDAIQLLSVLAFLPSGAQSTFIRSLIPTMSTSRHSKARVALLRTSLIYASPESTEYFVLPPIRSFMARHHKLTPEIWEGVFQSYAKFLALHKSDLGESVVLENAKAIGKEETNVEAVLLRALQSDDPRVPPSTAIETSLLFTRYQCQIRPRSEVAIAAVKLARDQNLTRLLPVTLYRLGNLEFIQGRCGEARAALRKAQREFERLEEPVRAARCLRTLGDIDRNQSRYDEARGALQQAQREFERLGEPLDAARCLRSVGNIQFGLERYDEARVALRKAQGEFRRLGDPLGDAKCLRSLGAIDRMQSSYDEALAALQTAQREFGRLGEPLDAAWCIQIIGDVECMQGRYDEARDTLQEAQREFERLGHPLGIPWCLQCLGNVDAKQGKYAEARDAFREAQQEFERMGDQKSAAKCLRSLGDIETGRGRD